MMRDPEGPGGPNALDALLRSASGTLEREPTGDGPLDGPPVELLPPRSPALRDADLEKLGELARERCGETSLHVACGPAGQRDDGWGDLVRRAWRALGQSGGAGAAFSNGSSIDPAGYAPLQHHDAAPGTALQIEITTPGDAPLRVVLLGESGGGAVRDAGNGVALTSRGVPARFNLEPLGAGDHLFVALALRDDPPDLTAVLDGRLDDLEPLGLCAAATLIVRVTEPSGG